MPPVGVSRPMNDLDPAMALLEPAANHRFPSGPVTMPWRSVSAPGIANVVTAPSVAIRRIRFTSGRATEGARGVADSSRVCGEMFGEAHVRLHGCALDPASRGRRSQRRRCQRAATTFAEASARSGVEQAGLRGPITGRASRTATLSSTLEGPRATRRTRRPRPPASAIRANGDRLHGGVHREAGRLAQPPDAGAAVLPRRVAQGLGARGVIHPRRGALTSSTTPWSPATNKRRPLGAKTIPVDPTMNRAGRHPR
jgi:hypothetical protein